MHTLNDISEIKTDIVEELRHDIRCKGFDHINPYELGQYVDMVKDLTKAEKDCWEKCYYEAVVEAMEGYGFDDEHAIEHAGRAGYDTRRYSSGRYAQKGKGHYSPVHGYTHPTMPHHTPMNAHMPMEHDNPRMGYPYHGDAEMHHEYGKAYQDYKKSMHHYHESGDQNEKIKKDHFAQKHVDETVETVKEIWADASPELKKKIKGDMSKLLAEMAI